ncbi:putative fungal specific transcription factor [Aspergillus nomiae NRRL 13137]|uniref:Putative fungal specific transcription factor n=1 Tax=Aspergillus nomiae NRRL (strain ATCC 15546 / NRRL 13137 / CBS 260.88 / M93) TaxID=1509407 RepID=A0A0L1IVD3_ASPN3|nr:putative fungal specific transcription factor [Aspergillus nomiae NRRL 13137]KNG83521.1 putative fungal specific transcription factor [Aspergillus nomiae NRRL 13137]
MEDTHSVGGSDVPEGVSSANPHSPRLARACDACRFRKIRCDRRCPCSHCAEKKIECRHAEIKIKEKRTRIHFTPLYEKKIDHIERQLDGIIEILNDLKVSRSDNKQPRLPRGMQAPSNEPHTTPAASRHETQADSAEGPVMEGDSSLTAHSAFAHDFLQNFMGADSVPNCSLEMRQTLDALAHTVATLEKQTASNEIIGSHFTRTPRLRIQNFQLPPIEKAVSLIRLAKSQSLAGAGWIYEFIQFNQFPDMCLGVYFSDDYPVADFISVNAGLHSLFWDYAFKLSGEPREEYFGFAHLCRGHLETALADLPLHLPATSSIILALTFGAFHFVELSKPSMAWIYSSKASELCQTLGYHRNVSMKSDSQDTLQYKQFLFWGIYFLDKSLSLRLGRASTIPDGDITIPRPSSSHCNQAPVMAYFPLWIESARCQGNIYAMLYSPSSLAQPDNVRHDRIRILVNDLQALDKTTRDTHNHWIQAARQTSGEDLINFFAVSDDVLRLSLLTLVHRATPPTQQQPSSTAFSSNCIKAAQATLQRHHDCMEVIHKNQDVYFPMYIHWTLLFAPFSPFIVIFCHVIETQDQGYLTDLHAFVESIKSAPTVSDAAARMYRLFLVLYNVALRYVEFRKSHQPGQTPAYGEMDEYLAALGLSVPLSVGIHQQAIESLDTDTGHDFIGQEYKQREEPTISIGNEADLDGWFSSNRAIMGLLQESDFNISPGGWIG